LFPQCVCPYYEDSVSPSYSAHQTQLPTYSLFAQVQTSCGYGVPLLSPSSPTKPLQDRETLGHWAGKTVSDNKMVEYRAKNNAYSLDNLPGLKAGRKTRGEWLWVADARAFAVRLWNQVDGLVVGFVLAFVVIDLLHLAGIRINGVLADWR